MITCTATRYPELEADAPGQTCGAPAFVRVTVTGADVSNVKHATDQYPTPWNLDAAPRCDTCARIDRRIVERFYPGASFDAEPIA